MSAIRRANRPQFVRWAAFGAIVCSLLLIQSNTAIVSATEPDGTGAEILWDDWGVPHIYADTEEGLFYAFGWAQMRSHGNLLLAMFGRTRGRAAELWGEDHLPSDRYMWTIGVPQMAARLSDDDPIQDAFAAGMNDFATAHPDALDPRLAQVLPLTGQDVLAQTLFTIYSFYAAPDEIEGIRQAFFGEGNPNAEGGQAGPTSNAWAISPERSTSGDALLLVNPHIFWPGTPGFEHLVPYEAHLVGPELNFYGAALLGSAWPSLGFNEALGWTFTSTPFDVSDYYQLTLVEGGYLFDGEMRSFETENQTLRVLLADGTIRDESLAIRRSIHGPVVVEGDDIAIAVQLPSLDFGDRVQPMEMMRAQNLADFLSALQLQQLTPLNFLYADRDGNIMYTLAGMIPDRPQGYDWGGILPGDTSASLWRGLLPYERMPQLVNPASGYLQNANDAPWTTTIPAALDPADFPADWPQPELFPRALISLELITEQESFSLEEVMATKFSTRSLVANRVVDDLVALGRQFGSPEAQEAAEVLANWDRTFDANSPGSLLFAFWAMQIEPEILGAGRFPEAAYAVPTDPARPFETPAGLGDPASAIAALEFAARAVPQAFGSLHVPWGAFARFRVGDVDLPAFGQGWGPFGLGTFTPNLAVPQGDGPLATIYGDTWVAAIEFADPVRAMAVMPYGNSSQPGSAHLSDQLEIYAAKQFRPVWYTRADIEANMEMHERFPE